MRNEIELPRQVALDAEGHVAEDLPCIRCEYNLRTLHEEAKCPECGMAVGQSIRGNWLQYSDPAWLRKVSRGLAGIILAFVVSLIFALTPLPIEMVGEVIQGKLRTTYDFEVAAVLGLVLLAVAGCGLVGLWWFTAPEPKPIGPASDMDWRRLVRFLGSAGIVAIAAPLLLGEKTRASFILRPIAGLLLVTWCAAALLYIRRLALRVPNRREARAARILLIAFLVVIGISVWSVVATLVGPGTGRIVDVLGAGGCLGLVLYFVYIVQLERVRHILKDIAEDVRKADGASESAGSPEQKTGA